MNIYIHLENIIRELDGKLLTGVLAASKGHEVIISDLECIEKGIRRGFLEPGIFHTKSLTPGEKKISYIKEIKKKGNLVTSLDEEGGLIRDNYLEFLKERYSETTINYASAVFCYGKDDSKTLKKFFNKYESKIHKTGSPRVDLWQNHFLKYWEIPKKFSKKPYLLVVSNMSFANFAKPFKKIIETQMKNGLYKIKPEFFSQTFITASEQFKTILAFIEAIKHLADNNKGYDIILRPHQNEDLESWKIFLEGIPNVYVYREGSITGWINNSFAVMHNGCTSALEATISKKPLLTYIPHKQNLFGNNLPNKLGYKIKKKNELLFKVNNLFCAIKFKRKNSNKKQLPTIVSKKVYIDNKELAAKKIINQWEKLTKNKTLFKSSNNWLLFKLHLKAMKINGIRSKGFNVKSESYKFPPFKINDINMRINKLKKILKIKKNLKCKLLSDKTILIK
ncbi:hypothetical protein N9X80_04550 [Candidatus Pelagibacter bacterium]|nr:hypothetical protein [Candidatus Pelagibacter bacterium]